MSGVDEDVFSGSVSQQPVMVNNQSTGTMMYVQRSESPKIIGIMVMCYYGISVVSFVFTIAGASLLAVFEPEITEEIGNELPVLLLLLSSLLSLIPAVIGILGGYKMYNYELKGLWMVLGSIALGWVLSIIQGALTSGYDAESATMGAAFNGICGIFCAGICGIIVCIPLFTGNHGME
jgi:uncharacterized membrane protein YwaF